MKKKDLIVIACVFLFAVSSVAFAGEKAPQKVVDLANSKLVPYGSDTVIVKAVKDENAKGKTLAQIKELDARWLVTPGIADYMKALMDSECGKHIKTVQKSAPYFAEIFVTDNQGANVAMTDKTSDYWQGDEPKFIQCYKEGQGTLYISDVSFDDSSQAYVVQVSVPVKDGDKTIGMIMFGINPDNVK